MNYKEFMDILNIIMTKSEMNRINVGTRAGKDCLFVDLHGMDKKKAERFVKNMVTMAKAYSINNIAFIHGFRHGTVLKHMISSISCSLALEKWCPAVNPGMTYVTVPT